MAAWCPLCPIAAAAMLLQIPCSIDEIVATGQFLRRHLRAGAALLIEASMAASGPPRSPRWR